MIELIAGIVAGIVVIVAAIMHGKDKQRGDTAKEVVDNVGKAKKVADAVRERDSDDKRERLRKYTKE